METPSHWLELGEKAHLFVGVGMMMKLPQKLINGKSKPFEDVHSLKLTWSLKIGRPKRISIPTIHFQGLCFREGISYQTW